LQATPPTLFFLAWFGSFFRVPTSYLFRFFIVAEGYFSVEVYHLVRGAVRRIRFGVLSVCLPEYCAGIVLKPFPVVNCVEKFTYVTFKGASGNFGAGFSCSACCLISGSKSVLNNAYNTTKQTAAGISCLAPLAAGAPLQIHTTELHASIREV
jgi:hypothetical protein